MYFVTVPERVRAVYDKVAAALQEVAGIQLHEGKTRVWNTGGVRPDGLSDLGEDVWNPEGVEVLGTPLGSDAFGGETCGRPHSRGATTVGGLPNGA